MAAGCVYLLGAFAWYSRSLPSPDTLLERNLEQSTKIYDREGKIVLYDIHGNEKRTVIKFEEIPEFVKNATVATEDKYFYEHNGFNFFAMFKGVILDPLMGKPARGGSTLTQQLVKNALLTNERSITRKLKEFILTYRLEKKYTKDEILQMYLNEIPYGSVAYGIQSAAQTYFAKDAKDLTLAESAILAALPKATTYYSPYGNHVDKLMGRQQYILDQMAEQKYITTEEAEAAKKQELVFARKKESIIAPHFVMYVKEALSEKLGQDILETGGLKVTTTLDLEKQQIAEDAIENGVKKNGERYKFNNGALVALDPKTGQILAMVGSKDYFGKAEPEGCVSGSTCTFEPNDNVTIRLRQPGSSIKPIVYAAAFEKGYSSNTILYDVTTVFKTDFKDYTPSNYDFQERGPVTIRQALAGSLNIPAVKTMYLVGITRMLDKLDLMGYTSFTDRSRFGLAIVLGGGEVKMLEHAAAYAVFPNEGDYHAPVGILKVEDSKGNILFEYEENGRQVLDTNAARMVNDILSDNNARAYVFGGSNYLTLGNRPVAAKSGTTNNNRDAWTMGYTPSLVAGVWVGNNNAAEMRKGSDGSIVAAPIWNEFMRKALATAPVESFASATYESTGKNVLDGIVPETKVKIDKYSGKLATDLTPASFVEEKVFKEAHSILYYVNKDDPKGPAPTNPNDDSAYGYWEAAIQAWIGKNPDLKGPDGQPIVFQAPPTENDDVHTLENKPTLFITSPVSTQTITGSYLDVQVNLSAPRGISRVEYSVDGRLLVTKRNAPFNLHFPISSSFARGYHALKVTAFDDVDNSNEVVLDLNFMAEAVVPGFSWQTTSATFSASQLPYVLSGTLSDIFSGKEVDFYYINRTTGEQRNFANVIFPQENTISVPLADVSPGSYEIYTQIIDFGGGITKSGSITINIQ